MSQKKVLIIGAGIGGLSTAALLAKDGHNVTILEKNDQIGGRAMHFEEKGFLFDMGPSWYLMPEVFERFFGIFGKKPSDYYTLKKLDPQYRVFFSKDDVVDIQADLEKNLTMFESWEKGSAAKITDYLEKARYQYDVAMKKFIYRNYNSIFDIMKPEMAEGAKLNVFENLDKHVSRYTKNKKIKQILQYTNVFLGGSPKNTPAMYSIMSHIDFHQGVFYPMGGMNKLITALEQLCTEYGVEILTNQAVESIEVKNKYAQSVKTKSDIYTADIVISNADYPFTEIQLLKKEHRSIDETAWKKKTIAPSGFILYLGIKGKVKNLKHHNLFFANDWEVHFDGIFNNPSWPEDPSYYICCPSKTDPAVAPELDENIFVLVPVAAGIEDSDEIREKYTKKIIRHIEQLVGESIQNRIIVQKVHSQRDFKELYNAFQGTALGLSHTLLQTAIFRPGNKSKKVNNLYYVGQFTNPGVGMPMCLISAELVREQLTKDIT